MDLTFAYIIGVVLVLIGLATTALTLKKAPSVNEPEGTQPPEPVAPAPVEPAPAPQKGLPERLYDAAAQSLGKAMKLDRSVPNLFACASSLSGVLIAAGVKGLPPTGIAGTLALQGWLDASPSFQRVAQGAPGDIIMSASPANPDPSQLAHGHCGIIANQGICSNDSDTGLWREEWTLPRWLAYYGSYGRLNVLYYRWISQ